MMRRYLLAAVLLPFLLNVSSAQSGIPDALRGVTLEQRLGMKVPLDLEFRNEKGQPVLLADLVKDKAAILSLVYYECPMLCTQVLNGLVSSLRALSFDAGKEFNIITVSFDPGETPQLASAKKESYLKQYGRPAAAPGWHFLTGNAESIRKLTDAVGFRYTYDPASDQFAHASGIMVLTPQGRLARYFYGIEYSSRDLRLALVEASDNKIGSAVDQFLLFCFHYDPSTGKYSATAVNLIRVGGIITVVCLGAFVIRMKRKERNHTGQDARGTKHV